MRIGVVFPQTEISADPVAARDYAQAAEELGYSHLLAYDHVLGADITNRPGWRGAYNSKDLFHEPFVLFGYLAGLTRRLELVTGVIILPQRQTALVAKQAAEVDILSGGRLRLGVGIGWNAVEYEGLNENFHDRGKRSEEQIALLRLLFSQEVVDFTGRWHRIPEAGINPLPGRAIPIWLGGSPDAVLPRVVALGDGWFPQMRPEPEGRQAVERLRTLAEAAGRDPATIGIEARIPFRGDADALLRDARAWRAIGATHAGINTMNAGFDSPAAHITAIRQARSILDAL
jgi:probable F420-dependent oxidoreductase